MQREFKLTGDILNGGIIKKWLVSKGDDVHEDDVVAKIDFTVEDGSSYTMDLLSPISGKVTYLTDGEELDSSALMRISYCTHATIFANMCTFCTAKVDRLPPRTKKLWESEHNIVKDDGIKKAPTVKAPTIGDSRLVSVKARAGLELKMSSELATDADSRALQALRERRKLILILDLDHTLLHGTMDPRAAKYAQPDSPILSEMMVFQSKHKDQVQDYFIKFRPNLRNFLKKASEKFELHIDTAATREYAFAVAAALDPTKELFGDRIISRCDTMRFGPTTHKSVTWAHRTLDDTSMTLILDDTERAWKSSPSLIRIEPYHFWQVTPEYEANNISGRSMVGTGPELFTPPSRKGTVGAKETASEDKTDSTHPVYIEETMSVLDSILSLLDRVHEEYFTQYDRRLDFIKKQEALRKANKSDAAEDPSSNIQDTPSPEPSNTSNTPGGDLSQVSPQTELLLVPPMPDASKCFARVRSRVLEDCCFVFSGVFPSNMPQDIIQKQQLWINMIALGATVADKVSASKSLSPMVSPEYFQEFVSEYLPKYHSKLSESHTLPDLSISDHTKTSSPSTMKTTSKVDIGNLDSSELNSSADVVEAIEKRTDRIVTHVVTVSGATAKVNEGFRDPEIRIVPLKWLQQCIIHYRRLPEAPMVEKYIPSYAEFASRDQTRRVQNLGTMRLLEAAYQAFTIAETDYASFFDFLEVYDPKNCHTFAKEPDAQNASSVKQDMILDAEDVLKLTGGPPGTLLHSIDLASLLHRVSGVKRDRDEVRDEDHEFNAMQGGGEPDEVSSDLEEQFARDALAFFEGGDATSSS